MKILLKLSLIVSLVLAKPQGRNSTESLYDVVEDTSNTNNTHIGTVYNSEYEDEDHTTNCGLVMANNGLNFSTFWHGAAHGIHSLYLEEIREYFEPEATVNNKIPVVNANLSSDQPILFNVPLAGYDNDFKTMALKVMAYFMLNDKPDFATQGINTLEKLTHQYHMHEIYAAAAPIYKGMKENPPKDDELCPCVNDITGNGILTEMANIAKQLKYYDSKRRPRSHQFGRGWSQQWRPRPTTYDRFNYQDTFCTRNRAVITRTYNTYRSYGCGRKKRSTENVTEATIELYEEEYLSNSSHENAEKLLMVKPWKINTLVGPKQWISYEAMLTASMLDEQELNDFVTFMFCKLNQPDLDHPKHLFE